MPHKITPTIRAVANGPAQAAYYCNIFPNTTITQTNAIVTSFEIFGQSLAILTGGKNPNGKINPSISFSLWIKDKNLTETIRNQLSAGGSDLMPFAEYPRSPWYGWCNDKYGVSRQVMFDPSTELWHETDKCIPSFLFVQENNGKAQEAMELYTQIFPASSIGYTRPYVAGQWETVWNIAHAEFTLVHQSFIAADSGQNHIFNFNRSVSLAVSCKDQAEVDYFWEKLISDWGSESQCGWCKDKYGVSRQIVPLALPDALFQEDKDKATYAMQAMLQMKKIVIANLYH